MGWSNRDNQFKSMELIGEGCFVVVSTDRSIYLSGDPTNPDSGGELYSLGKEAVYDFIDSKQAQISNLKKFLKENKGKKIGKRLLAKLGINS